MRVLVLRALGFQVEALEAAGAEVITIVPDEVLEQHSCHPSTCPRFAPVRSARRSRSRFALAFTRASRVFMCFLATWRQLRVRDVDVVYANAIADLLPAFLLIRIIAPRPRPLLVGSAHYPRAVGPGPKSRLRSIMIQLLCDGFVCISHVHLGQLTAYGVSPHKLAFVPNAYPSEWLAHLQAATTSDQREDGPSVLYVAHLSPRKAQHLLLHAAAHVLDRQPRCDFWLVGEPLDAEYASGLRRLARKLGIDSRVHLTGGLNAAQVAQRVVASSVVAFPSQREMMPRAVIEAMVAGRPVVASNIDGICDLIDHDRTGLLVEPGDMDGFAKAICKLLDNPEYAAQLAKAGQDAIREFCAPRRVGHLLVGFYASI